MGTGELLVRLLANLVCAIVQAKGRAVRPEGRGCLQLLAETVIRVNGTILVSEQVGVLAGFERDIRVDHGVLEEMQGRMARPILAVVNHFADCPLGVVGNAILVSYSLKQKLDIEPTVVFGMGASVVTLLRDRASRVTNIVMVGGLRVRLGRRKLIDLRKSNAEEILSRLRVGQSVLIYPEKKNSRELLRGDFRSGRVIYHAAEDGVAVVPIAISFSDGAFQVHIGRPLDKERVLRLATMSADRTSSGQRVVDYAMAEIGRLLPEDLRGPHHEECARVSALAVSAE